MSLTFILQLGVTIIKIVFQIIKLFIGNVEKGKGYVEKKIQRSVKIKIPVITLASNSKMWTS